MAVLPHSDAFPPSLRRERGDGEGGMGTPCLIDTGPLWARVTFSVGKSLQAARAFHRETQTCQADRRAGLLAPGAVAPVLRLPEAGILPNAAGQLCDAMLLHEGKETSAFTDWRCTGVARDKLYPGNVRLRAIIFPGSQDLDARLPLGTCELIAHMRVRVNEGERSAEFTVKSMPTMFSVTEDPADITGYDGFRNHRTAVTVRSWIPFLEAVGLDDFPAFRAIWGRMIRTPDYTLYKASEEYMKHRRER